VLVDPVRRQPAHESLVPPRGPVDLLVPRPRGVPVVADVVVVEDHAARHRGQQPPVRLVAPGEPVEVGVLLVVLDLLPGWRLDVAPARDELSHRVRCLVGIDLVAEEGDEVGPLLLATGQGEREGAQRVDAVGAVALPVVRHGRAARAEEQARGPTTVDGADARRGKPAVGLGPDLVAVDGDGVVPAAARLEAVDDHEGVVAPLDGEGRGGPLAAVGPDGDDRGARGLDPHRRVRLSDVAQHGAEDEGGGLVGHTSTLTARRGARGTKGRSDTGSPRDPPVEPLAEEAERALPGVGGHLRVVLRG